LSQTGSLILILFCRLAGVPVGGGTKAGAEGVAASDFATSDAGATGVSLTMKRPTEKLGSFAALIVYSMSVDAPVAGAGASRPASPGKKNERTYLAGSKALDALAKLIQATEGFFHPSNYGAWAPHLVSFAVWLISVGVVADPGVVVTRADSCRTSPGSTTSGRRFVSLSLFRDRHRP
jgi:proteasome activator subunit 4